MKPLPQLMVAPNGARKSKTDHAQLPITIRETVDTAKACHAAGADAIHLHVRDAEGGHRLDSALYRDAIDQIATQVPDLIVQITTEAVGLYTPEEQRQVVRDVSPDLVSISLAEMLSDSQQKAADFYRWCTDESIAVQHILYGPDDLDRLESLLTHGHLSGNNLQLLYVLGRYTKNQISTPEHLTPFTHWLTDKEIQADWAICAFGKNETSCLHAALIAGGKVRVGFENSFWNRNGSLAKDNAERVAELKLLIEEVSIKY